MVLTVLQSLQFCSCGDRGHGIIGSEYVTNRRRGHGVTDPIPYARLDRGHLILRLWIFHLGLYQMKKPTT